MNQFEHFFKPIVDVGLFTFGLANAGVVLSGDAFMGSQMWIIFLSLLIGKTIGIWLFSLVGIKFGLSLPAPMTLKMMVVVGIVAGIGFTVALFVTTVAINSGGIDASVQDMLKLGALMSFTAGPIAWIVAKIFGVEKIEGPQSTGH